MLTTELIKANQHIEFLSNLAGQKIEKFGAPNMMKNTHGSQVNGGGNLNAKQQTQDGSYQFFPSIKSNQSQKSSQMDHEAIYLSSGKKGRTPLK